MHTANALKKTTAAAAAANTIAPAHTPRQVHYLHCLPTISKYPNGYRSPKPAQKWTGIF